MINTSKLNPSESIYLRLRVAALLRDITPKTDSMHTAEELHAWIQNAELGTVTPGPTTAQARSTMEYDGWAVTCAFKIEFKDELAKRLLGRVFEHMPGVIGASGMRINGNVFNYWANLDPLVWRLAANKVLYETATNTNVAKTCRTEQRAILERFYPNISWKTWNALGAAGMLPNDEASFMAVLKGYDSRGDTPVLPQLDLTPDEQI